MSLYLKPKKLTKKKLQILPVKGCNLFKCCAALLNTFYPGIREAPAMLAFQKFLRYECVPGHAGCSVNGSKSYAYCFVILVWVLGCYICSYVLYYTIHIMFYIVFNYCKQPIWVLWDCCPYNSYKWIAVVGHWISPHKLMIISLNYFRLSAMCRALPFLCIY